MVVDSGADLVGPAASWLSSPSNQSDQPGYGDQLSSHRPGAPAGASPATATQAASRRRHDPPDPAR